MAGPKRGIERATGRDRAAWFGLLDDWEAVGRPYREIAAWLTQEHGLSAWWAQKLIVEYEQARGVREPGLRPDGTFQVSASKVVAVPRDDALRALRDPALQARVFPGVELTERPTDADGALRFEWNGGPVRLVVSVGAGGQDRSQVAVQLERISDGATATEMKEALRGQIAVLKQALEDR